MAALFTVALVALLAAVGASVDVGRLTVIHQRMQTACDMAATGGVSGYASMTPSQIWQTAAQIYAANASGPYGDGLTPVFITNVSDSVDFPGQDTGAQYRIGQALVTISYPYKDATTTERGYNPNRTVQVQATRTCRTPFTSVVGIKQAVVAVRAGAVVEGKDRKALLFALSKDPSVDGVDWSSMGGDIQGDIHSNTAVDVTGGAQTCTGWIDYQYNYDVSGGTKTFPLGPRVGMELPDPLNYQVSDFEPFDYTFRGTLLFPNHTIPAGVYYVDGNLIIQGDDVPTGPVTFVVTGTIQVAGTAHDFAAARNNILFFSTSSSNQAMRLSCQGGAWTGAIYAPKGNVSFSASGQACFTGGIVANTITLTGNDFTANGEIPLEGKLYSHLWR